MSADTKAALEAALQAHISSEFEEQHASPNVLVGGYVTKVHVIDLDGDTQTSHYYFIKPDGQAHHETYGLLLTAQDDFVSASMESDDDD